MNQAWKRLLIGCLAAVQCIAITPIAFAEGEQTVLQAAKSNIQGPTIVDELLNAEANNGQMEETTTESDATTSEADSNKDINQDMTNTNITNTTGSNIDTSVYGDDVLVILSNSDIMIHNNVEYHAPQPITIIKGVSYVSLRTLTERFGFTLSFDNETKESIISSNGRELRYKINQDTYLVDGESQKMSGESYLQDNTFMVPLTSALQAFEMPYVWEDLTKRIIVQMSSAPVAKFSIVPQEIFANETEVIVKDESYHPRGLSIVEYEWTGLESYYADPGQYMITLRVMDENGVWSDPVSTSITVLPPNEPPIASFDTNKNTYKMGELITYEDMSSDDEDAIVEREWSNNQKAFFEPGDYVITLRVTDKHGASSEVAKRITVTNETLYTFDQFNKVYTAVGDAYPFSSSITSYELIEPITKYEKVTLYRSNSPESVNEDGILYQDYIAGAARVLMHHKNATDSNLKLYVIARNISDQDAIVRVEHTGIAGPNIYPQQTGKVAAERYFNSYDKEVTDQVLKPNEATILVPELSQIALKPDQIYTMYADFYSDNNIRYQIVALDASKDIWEELPHLKKLNADGVHIRGTFNDADRTMTVKELVGETTSRLLFADNKTDLNINGWDTMSSESRVNAGNYGVLYHVKLERVAPNTLISFNARGGSYAGAILVNGETVSQLNQGLLQDPKEASPVYRTGNVEESVDIWFTPAAGSSMPVNLLFEPIPEPSSN